MPPSATPKTRLLYLHGFASGPSSKKGVAVAERYGRRGLQVERLDLRVPTMEHLRATVMMDVVQEAIGQKRDRVVLVGSSLGGYVAARVAERDARVFALVLLAPGFGLLPRWRARLGEEGWAAWQKSGWLEIDDHATGRKGRVDYGFVEDMESYDRAFGDAPDVRVPTTIVHGLGDEVVPIEGSRRWAVGRPNVRLVELDDGHELAASLPRIFEELDRSFEVLLPSLPKG